MNNNLAVLWNNPHLRYAAIAIAALEILAVWIPEIYAAKVAATEKILTFYAVAAAANSGGPNPPAETPPQLKNNP